jgi:hypothetical protein
MEYIKDLSVFKCTIDGITFDCHIKFEFGGGKSKYLKGTFIKLKVQKWKEKSFLCWKWNEVDFEYDHYILIAYSHFKLINGSRYFKPELVKTWVEGALRQREREILQKDASKEEEKLIKILKEI